MLTSPIRQALGAHLGQVLTPDVAAAIELAACAPVDESFDPERFGSVTSGDYTIQAERFADVLDEMHALHVLHWSETEKHRAGLSMRPDYLAAMAPGFTVDWTLANNSVRNLNAADLANVGAALGMHVAAQHAKARLLRSQIEAATTVAEVDAVTW